MDNGLNAEARLRLSAIGAGLARERLQRVRNCMEKLCVSCEDEVTEAFFSVLLDDLSFIDRRLDAIRWMDEKQAEGCPYIE